MKTRKLKTNGNSIDHKIGARLQLRRSLLKITPDDLAARLGIGSQQISKYEKGLTPIKPKVMENLCEILGVPFGFFFDENIRPLPYVEAASYGDFEGLHLTRGFKLLEAYTKIRSAEVQVKVLEFVRSVAALPPD